jgi:hypothetical protein
MSEIEVDWAAADAVRERVERKLEAERLAAERNLKTARQLAEAATASGLAVWRGHVSASRHYGLDVAGFWADDPADGWHGEVLVIPAGVAKVISEAIHECRERLAGELAGRLAGITRPDGSWPEAEMTQAVKGWLLDHGLVV